MTFVVELSVKIGNETKLVEQTVNVQDLLEKRKDLVDRLFKLIRDDLEDSQHLD